MAKRRIHLTESQLYGLVESTLNEMDYNTTKTITNGRGMKRNIKESIKTWVDDEELSYAQIDNAEEAVRFVLQHKDDADMSWSALNGNFYFGLRELWVTTEGEEFVRRALNSAGMSEQTPLEDEAALLAFMKAVIKRWGYIIFGGIPEEDKEDDKDIRHSAIQAEIEKAMKRFGISPNNEHLRDFLSDYFYDHYDWNGGFEYDDYDLFSEIKDEMTRMRVYGESIAHRVTENIIRKLRRM